MPKSLNPVLLPGDPSTPLATTPKQYVDLRAVPPGGMVGQALVKLTANDYDYAWADQSGSGTGGGGGPHGHTEAEITGLVADLGALDSRVDALEAEPDPVLAHGGLTGLAADDHPQYLTQTRADLRYSLIHSHNYDPAGTAAGSMSTHEGALDPHPQYQTEAEGDARYVLGTDPRLTNARTPVAHNHPITDITGLVVALDGKEDDGTAAGAVSAHESAPNPHPGYLTTAEGDAAYDPLGTSDAGLDAHEAAANPHPGYLTPAEADAAYATIGHNHAGVYDPAGAAAAARTAHEAAADPHPGYLTLAEGDAAYAVLGHAHAPQDLSGYQLRSERGAVSGYASLDGNGNVPTAQLYSATATQTGIIRLTGDLGGTATAPTVPGLAGKADTGHAHTGTYDPAGTAASVVTAHEGAANPHPVYLTQAEADALYPHAHPYEPSGAVAAHAAAGDPHPGYLTQTEGDARYVLGSDGRLSDARTPTVHAASHASGGTDPITPAAIGAATSGHAHDLSGYVPTARTLTAGTGLTGGGDLTANRSFAVSYGSAVGTAVQGNDTRVTADQAPATASIRTLGTGAQQAAAGNDARLSDARTPLAHAHSGADLTSGTVPYARLPVGTAASTVAAGDDTRLSNARTPTTHAASHASGGGDPITPASIGAALAAHTHGGGGYVTGSVPDGSTTPVITHGLGTTDVAAFVLEAGIWRPVVYEAISTTQIRFTFASAPTAGQYRYLLLAGAPASAQNVPVPPVTLADAPTIATDAATGVHFILGSMAADRILGAPTNPTSGQRVLWEITATGAVRSLTLTTTGARSFVATDAAPDTVIAIPAGGTVVLGAMYSTTRDRFLLLSQTVTL